MATITIITVLRAAYAAYCEENGLDNDKPSDDDLVTFVCDNIDDMPGADLFRHAWALLPQHRDMVDKLNDDLLADDQDHYKILESALSDFENEGFTFDYGLDGQPFNLRLK